MCAPEGPPAPAAPLCLRAAGARSCTVRLCEGSGAHVCTRVHLARACEVAPGRSPRLAAVRDCGPGSDAEALRSSPRVPPGEAVLVLLRGEGELAAPGRRTMCREGGAEPASQPPPPARALREAQAPHWPARR